MTLKIHNVEQGTPEWHEARRGVITASTIAALLTPTGKIANNDTSRRAVMNILAERITGCTDEIPYTRAMERGHDDEFYAREIYSQNVAPVTECGFMTDDRFDFTIGYSPDGLVGDDGLIEVKSRLHAIQVQSIIDQKVPSQYMAQIQTGLLVSGRKWLDFISFPAMGGGKMMVIRVFPDPVYQALLVDAARTCEENIRDRLTDYEKALDNPSIKYYDTERREPEPEQEIVIDG